MNNTLKNFTIIFILLIIINSCITKNSHDLIFNKFPENFAVNQRIEFISENNNFEFIASLKKEENEYSVTFLTKILHTPLVQLTYKQNKYNIKYLYKKIENNKLDYREIINSMREIYESNKFILLENDTYALNGSDFFYKLKNIKKHDRCGLFPEEIIINSKFSYKFYLLIKTDSINC